MFPILKPPPSTVPVPPLWVKRRFKREGIYVYLWLNHFEIFRFSKDIYIHIFIKHGKFLAIISSNNLSTTLWLSFPSGTPTVHLVVSYRSLQRRQWHPTPVLLPGKYHGWRSLEGCRPWGRWGSDMTERLHFHFSLSCIGEGNGNPLQCSCLENPRDGEAWWAAVYGVT